MERGEIVYLKAARFEDGWRQRAEGERRWMTNDERIPRDGGFSVPEHLPGRPHVIPAPFKLRLLHMTLPMCLLFWSIVNTKHHR